MLFFGWSKSNGSKYKSFPTEMTQVPVISKKCKSQSNSKFSSQDSSTSPSRSAFFFDKKRTRVQVLSYTNFLSPNSFEKKANPTPSPSPKMSNRVGLEFVLNWKLQNIRFTLLTVRCRLWIPYAPKDSLLLALFFSFLTSVL